MISPFNEAKKYKRIKVLGWGSFGEAHLAQCISDGSLCVIKEVDLSCMTEEEKEATKKEAKLLEQFNHPNIVRFRESYTNELGKLCIVMDYADGGDLGKKIKEQKGRYFSEDVILDWFTQLCLALDHVHKNHVLHRDIKSQNVFLTSKNMVKLGDFGLAKILAGTKDYARTMAGTPYYLSPEIVNGNPYGFKADIWSLGVLLYELCALKPPFDADNLGAICMKIIKGVYDPLPNFYSKELRDLVSNLLEMDPEKRMSTSAILSLPVIQKRALKYASNHIIRIIDTRGNKTRAQSNEDRYRGRSPNENRNEYRERSPCPVNIPINQKFPLQLQMDDKYNIGTPLNLDLKKNKYVTDEPYKNPFLYDPKQQDKTPVNRNQPMRMAPEANYKKPQKKFIDLDGLFNRNNVHTPQLVDDKHPHNIIWGPKQEQPHPALIVDSQNKDQCTIF